MLAFGISGGVTEIWKKTRGNRKKGPFKSQSKCWNLFLHFGLTSKELFEVSFYMISLRRRTLVKKEREGEGEKEREREKIYRKYIQTQFQLLFTKYQCVGAYFLKMLLNFLIFWNRSMQRKICPRTKSEAGKSESWHSFHESLNLQIIHVLWDWLRTGEDKTSRLVQWSKPKDRSLPSWMTLNSVKHFCPQTQ